MKTLKPLAALLILIAALTACSGPGIDSGVVYMEGVLEKQLNVETSGYWQIRTGDYWLKASPTSGIGNAVVNLTVDPSSLKPGEHTSAVLLEMPGKPQQIVSVAFSFPRLTGSVVIGPAPQEPGVLAPQSLPAGPGRLLIGLQSAMPDTISHQGRNDISRLAREVAGSRPGIHVRKVLVRGEAAVLEVSDVRAAALELSNDPHVRYVEPDMPLEQLQFSDYRTQQWPHTVMRVKEAWTVQAGDPGVTVAVIDAGFEPAHPDLDENIGDTYDFVSDSTILTSRPACGPHGEHVAGIIAAEANTSGVDGVAPGILLHLLNVGTSEANSCPLYTSDIAEALYWVAGDISGPRAEIVNLSLGGQHSTTLQDAIEAVYEAGVTLVAASGNTATGNVLYPAAYPQVLAVSATGPSDELASYTTVGPEIFVSAPGGNGADFVLSTGHEYDADENVQYTILGMQGTSMASPAVAAIAALAKSVNASLTPIGIAGLLADSSVDLGATGRDEEFGYGRVDAYTAVTRANDDPPGFILRSGGTDVAIPVVEQFVADYVGGTLYLEVGTDDDWDGVLGESGEYHGVWEGPVEFEGKFFDVQIAVEQK